MGENIKKQGQAECPSCGQLIGFEIKNPFRKTQLIKCPVCKKFSWTATDTISGCLLQLAKYEETGFSPVQVMALRALWKECRKYPEIKTKLDEWEAKLNEIGENKNI